jgi:uracil-DNA glycosylase
MAKARPTASASASFPGCGRRRRSATSTRNWRATSASRRRATASSNIGQGVLLLNSVLTVEMGRAASHQGKGWERFTDAVIRTVNDRDEPAVFMLWGAYAQRKAAFVDDTRHLVLKAAHPSPLSAHNGFHGCRHFSQANRFLEAKGLEPIAWELPELS